MHVITMRMAAVISGVAIECGFGARCRGMLAGPVQGATCGAYGASEGRQGGDHSLPKGFPGSADMAGIGGGIGSNIYLLQTRTFTYWREGIMGFEGDRQTHTKLSSSVP